jgi:hypothetical protein
MNIPSETNETPKIWRNRAVRDRENDAYNIMSELYIMES